MFSILIHWYYLDDYPTQHADVKLANIPSKLLPNQTILFGMARKIDIDPDPQDALKVVFIAQCGNLQNAAQASERIHLKEEN